MEKWWIIKGVKQPTYIGLLKKQERIFTTIFLTLYAIIVFIMSILEFLDILPTGFTLSFITTAFLFEVFTKVFRKKKLVQLDIQYIRNILKILDGRIIKWCIPSYTIPVVAILDNGVHILVFYGAGGLELMLFKPIIYYRTFHGKPIVKYKWKKIVGNKNVKKGLIQLIYPHVDIKNTNYTIIAKSIHLKGGVENDKLLDLVDNFEKYVANIQLMGIKL